MRTPTDAAALTVATRRVDDPGDLLAALPEPSGALSWVSGGDGLVGWGEAARFEPSGPERFADAERWWARLAASFECRDEVGLPGTGPVAFASMAFADTPGDSVLVVPRVLLGRRDGVSWVTTVGADPDTATRPVRAPENLRYAPGEVSVALYEHAVALAVQRIQAGELDKVVLAHDLLATASAPLDERHLLAGLAAGYPSCWTYAVGGLVGATPETLLCRDGDTVSARLLAGTAWPRAGGSDVEADFDAVERELLASEKNRAEHECGVRSLVERLSPLCARLDVPSGPSVLRLANVAHLATDVRGTLRSDTAQADTAQADTAQGNAAQGDASQGDASLLSLAGRVHPTAAVGGTPTPDAVRAIAELEGMDRGRYAGPVGWLDARGHGEFGVALRCAQLSGSTARLFAGGGIMAGSEPENESAEAAAKFRPVREALDR